MKTIRTRTLLALPTAAVAAALFVTPALAATPIGGGAPSPSPTVQPAPTATTTGIIMRDGGICDPIRHMGC
jgi:hypothetical protein